MEEELVSGSSSEGGDRQNPPPTVSSIFEEHLPYYLAIGMSYSMYWTGDCTAVRAYRKAYEIRRRREERDLWRQGLYVYEAILDAVPLLRPFSKATQAFPYPAEPYPVTEKEAREQAERKQREEYEKQQIAMEKWMYDVQLARKRKEDGNDG